MAEKRSQRTTNAKKQLTFSVIASRIVRSVFRSVVFCGIATDLELKFLRHGEKYSTFSVEPIIIGHQQSKRAERSTFDQSWNIKSPREELSSENLCGDSPVKHENYIATSDDLPDRYMLAILVSFHSKGLHKVSVVQIIYNLYAIIIRENFRYKNAYQKSRGD